MSLLHFALRGSSQAAVQRAPRLLQMNCGAASSSVVVLVMPWPCAYDMVSLGACFASVMPHVLVGMVCGSVVGDIRSVMGHMRPPGLDM